jgi:hypothetical protein
MASPTADDIAETHFEVWTYPRAMRAGAGALLAASGLSLPLLLVRILIVHDAPVTSPMLLRAAVAFFVLPGLAALLVRRALRAELEITRDDLLVRVGGQSFVVSLAQIAAIEPWRVPLPMPGIALRLASSERFALGIAADDPSRLLRALAARGVATAEPQLAHPSLVYAHVKHALGRLGWRRMLLKYPLFGLAVAAVPFQAQQQIAYGGLLGQYHLEGVWPWLRSALLFWSTVTIFLVAYATLWRWPAEILAWLAARRGEAFAQRARLILEWICRVVYYAGVLLVIALRFSS